MVRQLSALPSPVLPIAQRPQAFVPTRQTSSSGRPKSPRIQVVLPEELCARLAALAEADSRTISNMAKVLIQQGIERLEQQRSGAAFTPAAPQPPSGAAASDRIREVLEKQQQDVRRPQRRGPRRVRLQRPPA